MTSIDPDCTRKLQLLKPLDQRHAVNICFVSVVD